MEYIVSGVTDIGTTKKKNQDSFSIRVYQTSKGKVVFAILCDGMGGLEKGEIASASIVQAYFRWGEMRLGELCTLGNCDNEIRSEWTQIATEYNEKIKQYGRQEGVNLGTTLTAMLLMNEQYYIINIGDTRAYEISDFVSVLTKDQTVVAREIELGNITEEEAQTDARRSVLLQCIGASEYVYPDLFFGNIKKDAVYMLCSDGFRHEISEYEIYQYLNANAILCEEDIYNNIESLIEINKQRKERDNITAIAIRTF